MMNNIFDLIGSFSVGFSVGIIFAFFNLPAPAPQVFAGILGIFGIFLGYFFIKTIL